MSEAEETHEKLLERNATITRLEARAVAAEKKLAEAVKVLNDIDEALLMEVAEINHSDAFNQRVNAVAVFLASLKPQTPEDKNNA